MENKVTHKRKRQLKIEDDTTALAALMDAAERPKRGRGRAGRGGSHPGRGGGRRGRREAKGKDERTMRWGSALITFSTRADGSSVVQGTCHRKHAHKHAPGKPSTTCRTTYNITPKHSEENCTDLVKMWLGCADRYTTRLKHQSRRFGVDEIVDNIEELKPASEYNSDSDREVAVAVADPDASAVAARPRPAMRPRLRIHRKAKGMERENG